MTINAFSTFSVCLEYLPYGTAPAWDAGCSRFYFAVLSDVPDTAVVPLMKAVGSQFKFRPTPTEILDVWGKISAPSDPINPAGLVAKLAERVQKHGAHGMPHPTLRNCYLAGPPPDLTDQEAAVVATWGGWGPFCEDESPVGVRRGQLLKVAEMVLSGHGADSLRQIRLEYLAKNPPALNGEYPAISAPGDTYDQYAPETRQESAQAMSRIQARTGDLKLTRIGEIKT